MHSVTCRCLLISAPASGQGKTTVTCALARQAKRAGLRVRVFKTGPDFLDPMILEQACDAPVYQLDLWMVGRNGCRALLHQAADEADLILIEGVMGLYDGEPSSADLAAEFGVPVLAVIDGAAMAQSFGAVAVGLAGYRDGLQLHGVVANRVGSPGHAAMLKNSLPSDIHWLGALPGKSDYALPERHLGLVQPQEIKDLDTRINAAADALGDAVDFDAIPMSRFPAPAPREIEPLLANRRIGVARDAAHAFIYPANLDCLRRLGAELVFFSPLTDTQLPQVDALYLPGGYPELHAAQLAANSEMQAAIRAHHAAGKPILAECGGMMSLFERLVDTKGNEHKMIGLLPGEVTMHEDLQAIAMQAWHSAHGALRGHTFHHSSIRTPLKPASHAQNPAGTHGEAIFIKNSLTASYMHFYFDSNPTAIAEIFHGYSISADCR